MQTNLPKRTPGASLRQTTEAHVIVRYDETMTDEARITGEQGTTVITFGPTVPGGHEHGETMLMHILRALVAPIGEDDER